MFKKVTHFFEQKGYNNMDNRKFGYIRVSTKEQNETRQIMALQEFGISERDIYIDKQSGKDFNREQYQLMLRNIRENDLVVFLSLDRMGRNYSEIQEQWRYITHELKADIKILDMDLLDTRGNGDNSLDRKFICDLTLQILAYVAEKERINIRARQEQGIAAAKANNVKFGRPKIEKPDNWDKVIREWKNGEITAKMAMDRLNLKKSTFYALIK